MKNVKDTRSNANESIDSTNEKWIKKRSKMARRVKHQLERNGSSQWISFGNLTTIAALHYSSRQKRKFTQLYTKIESKSKSIRITFNWQLKKWKISLVDWPVWLVWQIKCGASNGRSAKRSTFETAKWSFRTRHHFHNSKRFHESCRKIVRRSKRRPTTTDNIETRRRHLFRNISDRRTVTHIKLNKTKTSWPKTGNARRVVCVCVCLRVCPLSY